MVPSSYTQTALGRGSNPANCVDNACGALARMLASNLDACHFEKVCTYSRFKHIADILIPYIDQNIQIQTLYFCTSF